MPAGSSSSAASAGDRRLARQYLTADMEGSYTGAPDIVKQSKQELQDAYVRKYGGADIVQHALVGTDRDFDRPLTAGEREHQSHLRDRNGLDHAQILEGRREVRGQAPPSGAGSKRIRRRTALKAGAAGGRAYARTRRAVTTSSGAAAGGSLVLQALGVAIGLSLIYLILSPNGSTAFTKLIGGLASGVRLLIEPVDNLNLTGAKAGKAIAAGSSSSSTTGTSPLTEGSPATDVYAPGVKVTPAQIKRARTFGPAPGKSAAGTALVQGEI